MADEANPQNDDALLERLSPKIHSLINSALASHNKMADKKRAEDRDAIAKMLDEKLSALKPAGDNAEGAEGKGGKGGKGKGEDVELATLRKRLDELTQRAEQADQRAAQEREKNRAGTIRQTVADMLSAAGIDGARFKAAYAMLQQEGRIKPSDDLESDDAWFVDDTGNTVDLSVGIKSWLKSDDAKIFLPPSNARGSGSRPASGGSGPNGKPDPATVRARLAEAIERSI